MFGRWCSNRLVDHPYHFARMNVIGEVSFVQVQLMLIDNGRHRSMHAHVVKEVVVGGVATIVHSDVYPFEYFRCCCYCGYRSICCCCCCYCSTFDLMMRRLVVAAVSITKCF